MCNAYVNNAQSANYNMYESKNEWNVNWNKIHKVNALWRLMWNVTCT